MKKTILLMLISCFLGVQTGFNQISGPASNWYFGQYAGLTWDTLQANGDPMYLMDGALSTNEGVATISDNEGNLLFYTDGSTVWNSNHQAMANSLPSSPGGDLNGSFNTTQSAIIIPKPNDPNTYYIFTIDVYTGFQGMAYSRVDMNANGGLGDIDTLEKNIPLCPWPMEKMTAVQHANGTDIWVIIRSGSVPEFLSYLVTSSGVQLNPVISAPGSFNCASYIDFRGCMKASPAGDMVCMAIEGEEIWELYRFDNASGKLSDLVTLDYPSNDDCYGVEFSADGHFLYGSERYAYDLHQWDVSVYDSAAIVASHQIVATTSTSGGCTLQLGPDQKIYLTRPSTKYLGRINNPSLAGSACDFDAQAVLLGPTEVQAKYARSGLPNFITSYFHPFTYKSSCDNDTVFFYLSGTSEIDSAWWNFNWPSTNPMYQYAGSEDHTFFIYDSGGVYTLELITILNNNFDTTYHEIYYSRLPDVNLGADTILCLGDSLYIDLSFNDQYAIDGQCDYYWEANIDGQVVTSTAPDYLIKWPGSYLVNVNGDSICGYVSDVLNVAYIDSIPHLGRDTAFCQGDSLVLDVTTLYSSYLWSTGDTTPVITVGQSGLYSVTVSNNCETLLDSIHVNVFPAPDVFFSSDTTYLSFLDPDVLNQTLVCDYLWSDGSTDTILTISGNAGYYSVTVTNEYECWDSDSIYFNIAGITEKLNTKDAVIIYPNPATSEIIIEKLEPNSTLEIYSLLGELLISKRIEDTRTKLSIVDLAAGTYILKLRSEDYAVSQLFEIVR